MFATLMWEETVASWQVLLVASRDLLVTAGALRVAARSGPSALKHMPPTVLGKCTTTVQFLFLVGTLARRRMDALPLLSVLSAQPGGGHPLHDTVSMRS